MEFPQAGWIRLYKQALFGTKGPKRALSGILLAIVFFFSVSAFAGVRVSDTQQARFQLAVLPSSMSALPFSKIRDKRYHKAFRPLPTRFFQPPSKTKSYWLRVQVQLPKRPEQDWILTIEPWALGPIEAYRPLPDMGAKPRRWQKRNLKAGLAHGLTRRLSFPMYTGHGETVTFYFRTHSAKHTHWSGAVFLELLSQTRWRWFNDLLLWLYGLYYGVIFGLMFVHLFLFLWLNDQTAKWFVIYHLALVMYMLGGNGLLLPLSGWSPTPMLFFRIQKFVLGWYILGAVVYTRVFLQTRHIPRLDKLLTRYIYLVGLYMLCVPWASPDVVIRSSQILGLLSPLVSVWPGWVCWRRGFSPALIYLLGWGVFAIATFIYASPLWDPYELWVFQAGSVICAILISLAMVQRIRLLREKRELAEQKALQAEKMATLGQLVAGVAHEVNNPTNLLTFNLPILREYLNALSPHLQRAQEQNPHLDILGMSLDEFLEDTHDLLDNMEHGADRIKGIVQDLRGYVQSHRATTQSLVDIEMVIQGALRLIGKQVREQAASLEQDIASDLPKIWLYPGRIEQILINLLLNAAQVLQSQEKGKITIRARYAPHSEKWIFLEVEDNGHGIPKEQLDSIFAPFFTTKGRETNMGLGLAISRRLAEEHGGTLSVSSVEGQGSCFTIQLPVTEEGRGE